MILAWITYTAGAQTPAVAVADSLYQIGDYSRAIQLLNSLPPKNPTLLSRLARAYQSQGNDVQAMEHYRRAIALDSSLIVSRDALGKLLISNAQFQEAATLYESLLDAYPKNAQFHYQRARAYQYLATRDTVQPLIYDQWAIDAFSKAVALDSSHFKAMYELGKIELKARNYPMVEQLGKKVLAQAPDHIEMLGLMGQNYSARQFYRDAIPYYERLLDLGQRSQFLHEKLGMAYYQTRFYELAVEQYLAALAYAPQDDQLHLILAKLYGHLSNLERAEYHAKQALFYKDLPLDEEYFTLGNTYKLQKKFGSAIAQFQKALEENPDHEKAFYALAVSADNYYKDRKAVIALYENYLEKYGDRNPYLKQLTEERVTMLREEVFMAADKQ
ncbi:tetratricopeptide repeat protein [Croceiramulus getboli]|nr:tetratricopeptide repeat protein [Flavobacteriaceae bacterium YJPT1-3]